MEDQIFQISTQSIPWFYESPKIGDEIRTTRRKISQKRMCGKSQQQKSSNSEKITEFLENRESLETFFLLPQIHLIKRFSPIEIALA